MTEVKPAIGAREAMPAEAFLAAIPQFDLAAAIEGKFRDLLPAAARDEMATQGQIAVIAARLLEPDLRPLLEWLLDQTLRRPLFLPGLGPDALVFAAHREGQNAVVWKLLQTIAMGRDETPPAREGV